MGHSREEQLLITLFKCRHNLDFLMISNIFRINRQTISLIFKFNIKQLFIILKKIDFWNSSFSSAGLYRAIIDCTEIPIARAANPVFHQHTFSNYKNRPTAKILIACDEKGAVIFVSDAFGGSISDREIIIKSNIVERFKNGDVVLADRGFEISDLLENKGVVLNIPPFLRGKEYFSEEEVMKTRVIANRRIIIGRVIGRAKVNNILTDVMDLDLWNLCNEIVFICFNLVNFYDPII